jgi:hypothetical protein
VGRVAHRRRFVGRVGLLVGLLLLVGLAVQAEPGVEPPRELPAAHSSGLLPGTPTITRASPYAGVGTWLSRYRFTHEFGGSAPPVTPADVDLMAAAGVQTIYLQPAADDPAYPGLLSTDLLSAFLERAHALGMQVVAWYLPHFGDVTADLRRLREIGSFRADGQRFDGVALDIEFTDAVELAPRNAALVDLSRRLRAALPDVELGAIVLPPVVTDVLNTAYWPDFPWRQLRDLYDVWLPMAYWSNRSDTEFSDPYRYVGENIARVRRHLNDPCAVVSVIGGYDLQETADDYAAMARAASEQRAIGVSVWDWPTTPPSAWSPLQGYGAADC